MIPNFGFDLHFLDDERWDTAICDNPGECGGYYTKCSKPHTEEIFHITYMESK
jgi:hypothetical protein